MDHSIEGYLKRRTTQELDGMLNFCVMGDNWKKYGYVVPMILNILRERDGLETWDVSAQVEQMLPDPEQSEQVKDPVSISPKRRFQATRRRKDCVQALHRK